MTRNFKKKLEKIAGSRMPISMETLISVYVLNTSRLTHCIYILLPVKSKAAVDISSNLGI